MKLPEILLIDKPIGLSSYDVIRVLKKKFVNKKIGHSGTLDPLATGLMIIGIEEGTKKLHEYTKLPKEYITEILLGKSTDTYDMEGNITEESNIKNIDEGMVKKVINEMKGKIILPVPIYSAVKVCGERLYKKARRGEGVKAPKKDMEIISVEFISLTIYKENNYLLKISLFVSSGTYIRSIAVEIGRRMSVPTCVYSLRRTKIGQFNIDSSVPLSKFRL